MIGILLITHGTLGEQLIECATHVLNKPAERLESLGVCAQDDPTTVYPTALERARKLDAGAGILVLTDMYGGTPSNIATKLVQPGKVEVVAGVNLPMLVRTLTYRERDLQTIVNKAISGGREGVMRVSKFKLHHAATGS